MIVSEIKLYELLKAKIGEKEADAFVQILESKVDTKFEEVKEHIATKLDIEKVRVDIEKLRGELVLVKWMLGMVLAGIISLVVKTFFA